MNVLHPFVNYVPSQENDINGVIHQDPKFKVICDSTPTNTGWECKNAITPSIDSHMRTFENGGNNWLQVNFTKNFMAVTHYSVQSNIDTHGGWPPPRNWSVYASDGISDYVLIDFVSNAPIYQDKVIYTRNITFQKLFSSFKFVMNGTNYGGLYDFRFYKVDFFGTVYRIYPKNVLMSCSEKTFIYLFRNIFVFIFM